MSVNKKRIMPKRLDLTNKTKYDPTRSFGMTSTDNVTEERVTVVPQTKLEEKVVPVVTMKTSKIEEIIPEIEVKEFYNSKESQVHTEANDNIMIDLDMIDPYKYQARKTFNDSSIKELSDDIATRGLQIPVRVIRVGDRYQVTCGERRVRASKLAGLKAIKAIVEKDDQDAIINSFNDNDKRENYCYTEKALFWQTVLDQGLFLSGVELARKLNVDPSEISRSNILKELTQNEVNFLIKERAGRKTLEQFVKNKRAKDNSSKEVVTKPSMIKLSLSVSGGKLKYVNGLDQLDLDMALSLKTDLDRYIERLG